MRLPEIVNRYIRRITNITEQNEIVRFLDNPEDLETYFLNRLKSEIETLEETEREAKVILGKYPEAVLKKIDFVDLLFNAKEYFRSVFIEKAKMRVQEFSPTSIQEIADFMRNEFYHHRNPHFKFIENLEIKWYSTDSYRLAFFGENFEEFIEDYYRVLEDLPISETYQNDLELFRVDFLKNQLRMRLTNGLEKLKRINQSYENIIKIAKIVKNLISEYVHFPEFSWLSIFIDRIDARIKMPIPEDISKLAISFEKFLKTIIEKI